MVWHWPDFRCHFLLFLLCNLQCGVRLCRRNRVFFLAALVALHSVCYSAEIQNSIALSLARPCFLLSPICSLSFSMWRIEWALICWWASLVQYLCVFTADSALLLADNHSPPMHRVGRWLGKQNTGESSEHRTGNQIECNTGPGIRWNVTQDRVWDTVIEHMMTLAIGVHSHYTFHNKAW